MKHSVSPVTLRIREGSRVEFRPTPASYQLYSSPPRRNARGTVTTVPFPGGQRRTSLPGPGGGLVYVKWDDGSFQGVSPIDLFRIWDDKALQENPEVSASALAAGAALIAGTVWYLMARRGKELAASSKSACPVSPEKLYDWNQQKYVLLYLFELTMPPSVVAIQKDWPQAKNVTKLLVVLKDGEFWSYATGVPVAAPELRASYCEYVKGKS